MKCGSFWRVAIFALFLEGMESSVSAALAQSAAMSATKPQIAQQIISIHVRIGGAKLCGINADRRVIFNRYLHYLKARGENRADLENARIYVDYSVKRFNDIDPQILAENSMKCPPNDQEKARKTIRSLNAGKFNNP